jgi:hypothetical protein
MEDCSHFLLHMTLDDIASDTDSLDSDLFLQGKVNSSENIAICPGGNVLPDPVA